jgi:hypothetical protein
LFFLTGKYEVRSFTMKLKKSILYFDLGIPLSTQKGMKDLHFADLWILVHRQSSIKLVKLALKLYPS